MTHDEKLTAWLMVMQYNFAQEDCESFHVPDTIREEMVARGWCEFAAETDWQGRHDITLTDKGAAIRDLHGPEWGLITLPEETEA